MLRLYFDSETTGTFPKVFPPLEDCPHIVQLAALLVDDAQGETTSMNAIIRPDGWTIPEGAAAVHGITTGHAVAHGLPGKVVLAFFSQMCRRADQIVAHNVSFDLTMIGFEMARLDAPNIAATLPNYCTMLGTKDILKLPGLYNDWKYPKLMESYEFFFKEKFDKAHDALADLRACHRIHRHLLNRITE